MKKLIMTSWQKLQLVSVKGISRHVDKTELNTRSTYIHEVAEDSVITMSPTDPSVAQFIQGTLSLKDTDDDISAEAFGDVDAPVKIL